MTLTIQQGKSYIRRDGVVVRQDEASDGGDIWPWLGSDGIRRTKEGHDYTYCDGPLDLVAEYTEPTQPPSEPTDKPKMTLPNGDIIHEGDYAVTRDGEKVGPMRFGHDGSYRTTHPWIAECCGLTFTAIGMWEEKSVPDSADLIAKWNPVESGPDPVAAKPDYNDGQWHGWNGKECPVHPKSMIEIKFLNIHGRPMGPDHRRADRYAWHLPPPARVLEFRVITPFVPKPKRAVFWLTNGRVFQSAREAKTAFPGSDPLKVGECKK